MRLLRRLAAATAIVASLVPVLPGRAESAPCWQRVIDEWSAGRLGANHPTACYRQAIAHAPADLRLYSTFDDDVRRAMQTGVLDHAGGPVRQLSGSPPARPTGSTEWRPGDVTLAASAVVLVAATWTATGLLVWRRRRASGASSSR